MDNSFISGVAGDGITDREKEKYTERGVKDGGIKKKTKRDEGLLIPQHVINVKKNFIRRQITTKKNNLIIEHRCSWIQKTNI